MAVTTTVANSKTRMRASLAPLLPLPRPGVKSFAEWQTGATDAGLLAGEQKPLSTTRRSNPVGDRTGPGFPADQPQFASAPWETNVAERTCGISEIWVRLSPMDCRPEESRTTTSLPYASHSAISAPAMPWIAAWTAARCSGRACTSTLATPAVLLTGALAAASAVHRPLRNCRRCGLMRSPLGWRSRRTADDLIDPDGKAVGAARCDRDGGHQARRSPCAVGAGTPPKHVWQYPPLGLPDDQPDSSRQSRFRA